MHSRTSLHSSFPMRVFLLPAAVKTKMQARWISEDQGSQMVEVALRRIRWKEVPLTSTKSSPVPWSL